MGWLGLNTASRAGGPGDLVVHPVVGVRYQPVEARVAQGRGERMHPYIPPTTSEPLYWLVPAKSSQAWKFYAQGPPAEPVVADLVAA